MTGQERRGGTRLRRATWAAVWVLLSLAVPLLLSGRAMAAINLVYFRAETETNRIKIEWETATELNNAGFFVLRSQTGGSDPGAYTQITVIDAGTGDPYNFIPARGDDLFGAVYTFYDQNVVIGQRYYYLLQDIDTSNFSSYHGPVQAVAGHTSTPVTTPPTATSVPPSKTATQPASTGVPSATPSRTNTAIPGFNPTSTPAPTITRTGSPFPTETPTFTETSIPPVNLTLTGIAAALTGLPTGTATRLPPPGSPTTTPTRTPVPSVTAVEAEVSGDGPPLGRILLVILVFLASGALLTAGVVFIARGGISESAPAEPSDE